MSPRRDDEEKKREKKRGKKGRKRGRDRQRNELSEYLSEVDHHKFPKTKMNARDSTDAAAAKPKQIMEVY
jgi:hypothetical protein